VITRAAVHTDHSLQHAKLACGSQSGSQSIHTDGFAAELPPCPPESHCTDAIPRMSLDARSRPTDQKVADPTSAASMYAAGPGRLTVGLELIMADEAAARPR
jgi:hypothetical protein